METVRRPIVGVDFDNTIISYDNIIPAIALERGLIDCPPGMTKKQVRDAVRKLPDGEKHWQRLQAVAYGPRLMEAQIVDGLEAFVGNCRERGVTIYIVSHKTQFATMNEIGADLRAAALEWMARKRFFEASGLGFGPEEIYFEDSRLQKVARIKYLQCTHFVDDLEETFLEDGFPEETEKILFSPHEDILCRDFANRFSSWTDISEHILGY